jgi:hypothetical protein
MSWQGKLAVITVGSLGRSAARSCVTSQKTGALSMLPVDAFLRITALASGQISQYAIVFNTRRRAHEWPAMPLNKSNVSISF